MEIVINDTNIFIDLYSIDLIDDFFKLPISVHTVDFVINELTESKQLKEISKFIANGKLNVRSFSSKELTKILMLKNEAGGNVSFTDCSVWYYAKAYNYTLLTGDRQLREKASKSNVTVKGILYIFDILVDSCIITPQQAIIKLNELTELNQRLPKSLIKERIENWSNQ